MLAGRALYPLSHLLIPLCFSILKKCFWKQQKNPQSLCQYFLYYYTRLTALKVQLYHSSYSFCSFSTGNYLEIHCYSTDHSFSLDEKVLPFPVSQGTQMNRRIQQKDNGENWYKFQPENPIKGTEKEPQIGLLFLLQLPIMQVTLALVSLSLQQYCNHNHVTTHPTWSQWNPSKWSNVSSLEKMGDLDKLIIHSPT